MPATSITQLAIANPDHTISSPALQDIFKFVKTTLQEGTKNPVFLLHQLEDPTAIYLVSQWDTIAQHADYIPSAGGKSLSQKWAGALEFKWSIHLDGPISALPFAKEEIKKDLVFSLTRQHLRPGSRDEFYKAFESKKGILEEYVTEGEIGYLLRSDPPKDGEEVEEMVLCCPWKAPEQHQGFQGVERFGEFVGTIAPFFKEVDVKHVKLLGV